MRHLRQVTSDAVPHWRILIPELALTLAIPFLLAGLPLLEKQLVDNVVLQHDIALLAPTMLWYAALWILVTVLNLARTILRTYLGEQMTCYLRSRLLQQCEQLSLAFARREHSGRTASLFLNDVPLTSALVSNTLFSVIGSIVMLAVAITVMADLSWQLAVVIGIVSPVVAAIAWGLTRPLRPASEHVQQQTATLNERLQENLAGIREIVAFGQGKPQAQRFREEMRQLIALRMRIVFFDSAINGGQMAFSLAMMVIILGVGAYLVTSGQATLGGILAVRVLFNHVFVEAGSLLGSISSVQKSLASVDRVYGFLEQHPEVADSPDAVEQIDVEGSVVFDEVTFSYQAGRPVLEKVSFAARPGQVTALVGPSGSGKTTLVSLIARFYDPSEGRVTVDGKDLRSLKLETLRRHVGIVFQDSYLFAATIRENIAFGREGASEEEILTASRAANASEFISHLPKGLETEIGERGAQLSEGQRQRIAIARALLRNPRILILDEPTSALDARSEHDVQAALDHLMYGRTTFVIAHRLATVRRADVILVLKDGQIVERGTHDQLLSRNGVYRDLFDLQFGSGETDDDAANWSARQRLAVRSYAPTADLH